jgi:hypothetical protein
MVQADCVEVGLRAGYSALDVIGTLFRVAKSFEVAQQLKLEIIKVSCLFRSVWYSRIGDYSTSMIF